MPKAAPESARTRRMWGYIVGVRMGRGRCVLRPGRWHSHLSRVRMLAKNTCVRLACGLDVDRRLWCLDQNGCCVRLNMPRPAPGTSTISFVAVSGSEVCCSVAVGVELPVVAPTLDRACAHGEETTSVRPRRRARRRRSVGDTAEPDVRLPHRDRDVIPVAARTSPAAIATAPTSPRHLRDRCRRSAEPAVEEHALCVGRDVEHGELVAVAGAVVADGETDADSASGEATAARETMPLAHREEVEVRSRRVT